MQIDDVYISLTIKHLKKEASEEEKQTLFKWVYSTHENEKLFYNLKDIWETARYSQIVENSNTDKEWEKLALAAIQKKSVNFNEKLNLRRKLYRAIQIAAIIIITFGVGFFVQKLLPSDEVYSSVYVPYGAKSEVVLSDGSKVWLNSGSTLRYPSDINDQAELYLEGEAFFDIVENHKRRLNVKTSTINIQVLGTKFNVKSYNEDDVVETTLLKGSISVSGSIGGRNIKEPILLKPNEQAILVKSKESLDVQSSEFSENAGNSKEEEVPERLKRDSLSKMIPQLKVKEGLEVEPFVSWKDNKLVFKNERLEDLTIKIERWYNVDIDLKDDKLKDSRYTGTFENETIEQAIHALSLSLPFTYEINKNQIEITGKSD